MKKGVFIILCYLVLLGFVCAIPPTLTGEKTHVDSANVGDKVMISYDFDKIGQEVSKRQGVDVILILDTSGSMRPLKLTSAKNATKEFIGGLNPSIDRVGLGVINSLNTNRLVIDPTHDFNQVFSKIDSLSASGNTYGSNVVNQSVNFLKDSGRSDALKVIFLFTDGEFTSATSQKASINSSVNHSLNFGIKTYTSFFGTTSSASDYLRSLAQTGNGEYFDSPTGEDLKTSFLSVLNIIKKNVASNFVLNDSFLSGIKIIDEGFPEECEKFLVEGNFSISCKRDSLFSLESEPFNFSFFVNVTSSLADKLSTNTFVSYENYSGEDSVLFLLDKDFLATDNSIPLTPPINCSLLSGGFCSISLENATKKDGYFCDVSEEFCYICNEGFFLNSSTKQCEIQKQSCESLGGYCSPLKVENGLIQSNGDCSIGSCYLCKEGFSFDSLKNCVSSIEVEWVCESGFGFSYWNKSLNEKEWTYNSDSEFSGEISSCSKYSSFCCPTNFVCETNGKCSYKENFLEYCSSLKEEISCNVAPIGYAENEIISLRGDKFLETTCSNSWYENKSNVDCSLKSSCSCFWNSSLNKCLSREKIDDSCSNNGGGSNSGFCTYDKIKEENKCDSTGYYFREVVATISGNYPNPENCVNVSQEIKCSINSLFLPFFGIFAFILVVIVLVFVYFFLNKKN